MEVERGYIKTDVGVIPIDWEVKRFGEIISYTKGFAFKSKDYKRDGLRIVRVSDTSFDSIKKENGVFIDEKRASEFRSWRLEENDLIFSTVGSKPPMYDSMVGKVIMVKKEFEGSFLNQNAVLIRAKNRKRFKQQLLLNHFRTTRYLRYIEEIYRGNANQASITLQDLFHYKVPLSKHEEEQIAIAIVLSDTDELISSLEKLIVKKRNIKQGAMQQLLLPKDGWKVKKLGEVGKCLRGVNYKPEIDLFENDNQNSIRLFRSNNLQSDIFDLNNLQYVSSAKVKEVQKLRDNDIVICMSNGSKQLVGKSALFKQSDSHIYTFGAFMGCFRTDSNLADCKYVSLNFLTHNYRNYIDVLLSGSSINNLKPGDIESIEIPFPEKDEQSRIAGIVNDMDTELSALESKLDKYKVLKQGMMQNLLTGKIRLV
jgi:type I restriction enzyme, S subunit